MPLARRLSAATSRRCGGGRELLNSEAITEAIRPFNPPGEFGARHVHTLSTYANHRIRHGIRHTAALAGRRPRPPVPNERLRHMLIGYARVSKAAGSPYGAKNRPRLGRCWSSLPSSLRLCRLRCSSSSSRSLAG